jgi:parvulin-like peptidyl-prolyl isomerase
MRLRALPLLPLLASACGTVSQGPTPVPTPVAVPVAPPERPPVAWRGEVIEWTELRQRMTERSGAVVLEEALLDRQLERLLRERSLRVDADMVEREERDLLAGLSTDTDRATRLLSDLRAAQGLGDQRWAGLLRRNAAARLLVQDQVQVTQQAMEAAMDAAHGPRRRCRVLALPDLAACAEAKRRLEAGEPFGEVAAAMSSDRSAARGGVVNPVSRLDPTWPASFRQALWALPDGATSAPVMLEQGYVIVRMEGEMPATPMDPAAARAAAERDVRRAQERVQMEALVAGLREAQSDVVVSDEDLRAAWRRFRNAAR